MIKALLITLLTATLAHAQYDARTADYLRAWRIGAAGGELWTPAELTSLEAWYDFGDTSMSQLQGNSITNMLDKSGNGWSLRESSHGTGVALINNALNGLSVMDNSAAENRYLQTRDELGSFSITGGANRTIITLAKRPDNTVRYLVQWGTLAGTGYLCGLTTEYYLRYSGTTKGYTDKGANNTWTMAAVVGTNTTLNAYNVFFDGQIEAATATVTSNPTATINTQQSPLSIGGAMTGVAPLQGQIAEVIILDAAISTADRQRVEGYLAHKWGLTANLPAEHPYKSTAPTK